MPTHAGHGREFLSQYEAKIPEWVDFVAANNRPEAILSILTGKWGLAKKVQIHKRPLDLHRQVLSLP